MKVENFEFKLPASDVILLSGQTINKLLRSGDSDAALLYLYILKTNGKSTTEETMAALGKGLGWINSAMATLSRIGLIHLEKGETGRPHEAGGVLTHSLEELEETWDVSPEDMRRELEIGSDFTIVVDETHKSLGKILSPEELKQLFGIYDNLNMPPEVIMQLITYCISEHKRNGRIGMPKVGYIEKMAYSWAGEGILTLDKSEEYIKNLEARRSLQGEMKTAMQIRNRELSSTEKKYVDNWIALGFDVGAVEIAYDITVVNTGKMTWKYMDSIMQSWHNKGLHTAQEIADKDKGATKASSYKTASNRQAANAPNQEEINRMQGILDKARNEG